MFSRIFRERSVGTNNSLLLEPYLSKIDKYQMKNFTTQHTQQLRFSNSTMYICIEEHNIRILAKSLSIHCFHLSNEASGGSILNVDR